MALCFLTPFLLFRCWELWKMVGTIDSGALPLPVPAAFKASDDARL